MKLNIIDTFSKNVQVSNFIKIRPFGTEVFRVNRQKRRQANSRSSQFCARTYKWQTRMYTKCFYERVN